MSKSFHYLRAGVLGLILGLLSIVFVRQSLSYYQTGNESGGRAERMDIINKEEIGGRSGGVPEGEMAPDFALMPLKIYDFKTEKTEITEQNADLLYEPVKLSDFRGDKPVALIFGSYT